MSEKPKTNPFPTAVEFFARITGHPVEEIRWLIRRTRDLIIEGNSREERQAIIEAERASRPWEQT